MDNDMSSGFRAKASVDRTTPHPLFAHCADVAAVLERLIAPGTPLAARLAAAAQVEELHPRHRALFVYLAALHDMGKANHGFQEKLRPHPLVPPRGHVKILLESWQGAALLPAVRELLRPLGLPGRDAVELFAATIAHHGRSWNPADQDGRWAALWRPTRDIPRDPVAEIRRLGDIALRESGLADAPPAPPLAVTPALTHLFAGALTLADWLGSNEHVFEFTPDADPATYWATARQRAADVCARTGVAGCAVEPCADDGAALLPRLFPGVFARADRPATPTTLQAHVAVMPLPVAGSRVLVESETGSGKTEAALALYARLRAAGRMGGLVFALPTRATAKAMYDRIVAALPGIYGASRPSVALAVGGTQPRAESPVPELEAEPQRYDDDDVRRPGDPLAAWATERAQRFLAAEVVVGTLDQLLLGALPVRYAHLRLASLTRHLLVVDELHSFDRYMTGILGRLLELHTAHGGMALFMSATLSDAARREFGAGHEPETTHRQAADRVYPSLSVCPPGGRWEDREMASHAAPKRVTWDRCTEEGWMDEAVRAASAGARVLVVRNTVRGARAAVAALHAAGHGALLWSPRAGATPAYHSRYAPPDRAVLDDTVLRDFGRGGAGAGRIVVATQVAEQSLDVDFDLLVSDLCPVDVLLQRVGRLWRHPERRDRPGCPAARVWVVVPAEGVARWRGARHGGPNGWGTVYPDLGDLELTQRLVGGGEVVIPRDNRALVEAVYHPDVREVLRGEDGWSEYLDRRIGQEIAVEGHALQAALDFSLSYAGCAAHFSRADEAAVRTRLGDDRVRIVLGEGHRVPCRYAVGESVDFVELPAPMVAAAGVDPVAPVVSDWCPDDDGVRFRLGELNVWYGDGGWEWERRTPAGGA